MQVQEMNDDFIHFTKGCVEGMWRSSDWLMVAGHTGQHLVILHFYYSYTRKMSVLKKNNSHIQCYPEV